MLDHALRLLKKGRAVYFFILAVLYWNITLSTTGLLGFVFSMSMNLWLSRLWGASCCCQARYLTVTLTAGNTGGIPGSCPMLEACHLCYALPKPEGVKPKRDIQGKRLVGWWTSLNRWLHWDHDHRPTWSSSNDSSPLEQTVLSNKSQYFGENPLGLCIAQWIAPGCNYGVTIFHSFDELKFG